MKTLMTAAVAALALNAAVAQAGPCDHIPNPTRFNPTELSERQICFVNEFKADEEHGILGSLFWLRVNGKIYSTQWKAIYEEEAREAWLDSIVADQTDLAMEEHVEAIQAEAQAQLPEAIAEGDVEVVEALVEIVVADNAKLTEMLAHESNAIDIDVPGPGEGPAYPAASVFIKGVKSSGDHFRISMNGKPGNVVKQIFEISSKVNKERKLKGFHLYNEVYATEIGYEELLTEIGRMVDDAYDAGYQDGYEDGYAAGYADGFEDGVNSVK